ncbi:aldo/keto reductase [Candidatus Bipolaricaulota bacterium]
MNKRVLGRSGIEVSALGMGCWAIGGPWSIARDGITSPAGWGQVDDEESIRTVRAAVDAGITFFDTAANYGCGHSERILGKALGSRRRDVVIATKFGHIIDEGTKIMRGDDAAILPNLRKDCESSLRRLDTDSIDLYQLHEGSLEPEKAVPVRDLLETLVKEGKIRAYGWSTDHVDRAAVFADGSACASIQFSLNAFNDHSEMIELCAAHNLACINKKPLASGFLTGKFTAKTTFPVDDYRHVVDFSNPRFAGMLKMAEALRGILASNGRTMAQGALAWIWARSDRTIPIPGARTEGQVRENAAALERGPLTPSEFAEANAIVEALREEAAAQAGKKEAA